MRTIPLKKSLFGNKWETGNCKNMGISRNALESLAGMTMAVKKVQFL